MPMLELHNVKPRFQVMSAVAPGTLVSLIEASSGPRDAAFRLEMPGCSEWRKLHRALQPLNCSNFSLSSWLWKTWVLPLTPTAAPAQQGAPELHDAALPALRHSQDQS